MNMDSSSSTEAKKSEFGERSMKSARSHWMENGVVEKLILSGLVPNLPVMRKSLKRKKPLDQEEPKAATAA